VVGSAKATADTVYLMGGPGRLDGKFQLADGVTPDRQGWIGVDLTVKFPHWSVSTFNGHQQLDLAYNPNHVMWCGEVFSAACGPGDVPEGYGNGYADWLDWYGTVADNAIPTSVTVTCKLNNDSEDAYDWLYFEVSRHAGQEVLDRWTGIASGVNFSRTFSVAATDYVGAGANQIHLRWRADSDDGYSDSDCRYPSWGHTQLDNIQVTTNNGVSTFDDFEGGPVHWAAVEPGGCGDFSHVWPLLADVDPCTSNNTPQFAFIDDGVVVPGTGGSHGITWTYGPGGHVVNTTGGLLGLGNYLWNDIWSPSLTWPGPGYGGMQFDYTSYMHFPVNGSVVPVVPAWHVRDSTDGGATWGEWKNDDFIYWYRTVGYVDVHNDVTAHLRANRTHVQLALGVWESGETFPIGHDVSPAPYFDNVRCRAYSFGGPSISAHEIYLFQDNFPATGTIDRANLGNNSVRLDMACNISLRSHLRNDPGDSIVATVAITRTGSTLQGVPRLHYRLRPNPLFDAYRTSGRPNDGFVDGALTTVANNWRWDLPDTGFFFPGDLLHYYIEAQDNLGGDIGTTRLPADTTGFSLFPGMTGHKHLRYPSSFIVRALPTMTGPGVSQQPKILFWNDFADRGGENEWDLGLEHDGYAESVNYDEYYTNGASSEAGNGLGGRATAAQLAGYTTILYTSGDLGTYTLSNGDYNGDPSNDLAVMTAWLSQGGKKWFCTGDELAYDLGRYAAGRAFRNTFMPMTVTSTNVRPLIENQTNPIVEPVPGNPVGLTRSYVAYGGCPVFNTFDAVQANGTTSVRIATFRPVSGAVSNYAAAVYFPNAGGFGDDIIYMPYDFMFIYDTPNSYADPQLSVRDRVLIQVLTFFGQVPAGDPVGVGDTPAPVFSAKSYPNPFNPSTKIDYTLTRPGQVSIRVYNVRGELVRTLLDGKVNDVAGSVTWLGDDDRGRKVASGVYFCQVKSADDELFKKMTLVK
jgi:hypothetical protein